MQCQFIYRLFKILKSMKNYAKSMQKTCIPLTRKVKGYNRFIAKHAICLKKRYNYSWFGLIGDSIWPSSSVRPYFRLSIRMNAGNVVTIKTILDMQASLTNTFFILCFIICLSNSYQYSNKILESPSFTDELN